MLLTPTEMERLTIFTAAEMARRRRERGLKLNHPEAVAFIADAILEGAREGRSVADLIGFGSTERMQGQVAKALLDASDAGIIRIIDALAVIREDDEVDVLRVSDLDDEQREELGAQIGALIGLGATLLALIGAIVAVAFPRRTSGPPNS